MSDSGKLREQIASFDFAGALLDGNWNNPLRSEFRRAIHDRELLFSPIAEVGGVVAVEVTEPASGDPAIISPQARSLRKSIDIEVAKEIHQHILIFVSPERAQAVWHFSKVVRGKRLHREYRLDKTTPLEPLVKLLRGMEVPYDWLDASGELSHVAALDMMDQAGLYAEKVSKKFYNDLARQRKTFEPFLKWIADEEKRAWYITALLNRLMFIYFLQHKGLLGGDPSYLLHKLQECKPRGTDRFYREFFLPLCFFGFGKPAGERGRFEDTFKGVPYLNGGIFSVHQIEAENGISAEAVWEGKLSGSIMIPDSEFQRWFSFFGDWRWTLAEEDKDKDGHIHPDILGYIFEKYINAFQPGGQKGSGAYYSKEDITGYICRNTIIPRLFDMLAEASDNGQKAVSPLPIGPHPNLLNDGKGISQGEGIDRYIYDAVKTTEYLPTETEREFDARQKRYETILQDFDDGKIATVNDFITYNLDIEKMAGDFASTIQDAEVLSAFHFNCLKKITVLDPTCGSGAFLFAALKILYPLYEACLVRMKNLVAIGSQGKADAARTWKDEFAFVNEVSAQQAFIDRETVTDKDILADFRKELAEIGHHPHSYYIHKTIIVNNLFGVDIMEEAVEICKLRLFLKLIAHADVDKKKDNFGIEPLPDIDFNILAGNTLVGYTSFKDIDNQWSQVELDSKGQTAVAYEKDHSKLRILISQYREDQQLFRAVQLGLRSQDKIDRQQMALTRKAAKDELDRDLWNLYKDAGKRSDKLTLSKFRKSHQPFHWFLEFPDVMEAGGFDVVVGNPPFVEHTPSKVDYELPQGYNTIDCGNLYAYVSERCANLLSIGGAFSLIMPSASCCTPRMHPLMSVLLHRYKYLWISIYDERPAKLFDGVDQQLSIHLGLLHGPCSKLWTSPMRHWSSRPADERPHLFASIPYTSISPSLRIAQVIPKTGNPMEIGMLTKLKSQPSVSVMQLSDSGSRGTIYYRIAGGRYWRLVKSFPTYFRSSVGRSSTSTEKELQVGKEYVPMLIALLSSSTFYWFWRVVSNCRHLTDRELGDFPIPCSLLEPDTIAHLTRLCSQYEARLEETKVRKQTNNARSGAISQDEYRIVTAKPILDEIDRVLAKHYGFTEEELDFIINYDIKYRMGKDAENSD